MKMPILRYGMHDLTRDITSEWCEIHYKMKMWEARDSTSYIRNADHEPMSKQEREHWLKLPEEFNDFVVGVYEGKYDKKDIFPNEEVERFKDTERFTEIFAQRHKLNLDLARQGRKGITQNMLEVHIENIEKRLEDWENPHPHLHKNFIGLTLWKRISEKEYARKLSSLQDRLQEIYSRY